MRTFIVIYIQNAILETIVDGIRAFADPSQKHHGHITVRGPYEGKRELEQNKIDHWENEVKGTHIRINGLGTFFNTLQNTVYFKCESEELREIWWKKHFKGFHPHITIYDRPNRDFAQELADLASSFTIDIRFPIQRLEKLSTSRYPKNQTNLFDYPQIASMIDLDLLSKILDRNITKEGFRSLSIPERLNNIEQLLRIVSRINSDQDCTLNNVTRIRNMIH